MNTISCRANGGPAPCVDDLCHNCSPTLCGIYHEDIYDLDDDYEEEW